MHICVSGLPFHSGKPISPPDLSFDLCPSPRRNSKSFAAVPTMLFSQRNRASNSHMNAQFDPTVRPEEVVAIHLAGFRAAHAERVGRARLTFEKQWKDDDRVRLQKAPHIPNGLERLRKRTDLHLVERVLKERLRDQEDWAMDCLQLSCEHGMTHSYDQESSDRSSDSTRTDC
jgi:hypothetical protein